MPVISDDTKTRLRTTRHGSRLALSVDAPVTIWDTQVAGAQATGAIAITVDVPTVVRTPVADYQVLFGAAAGGSELGEARFKSYSAPTLTVSAHNTPLADNTYVTIKEVIPPTAKHVSIDDNEVVSEDGTTAYGSSLNIQYLPLARMGAPAIAYLDQATGLATVKFYGRGTATVGSLTGHGWDIKDGTAIAGAVNIQNTVGSPLTVTFPSIGRRYIGYMVTDSNTKTHTRYNSVRVYDSPFDYVASPTLPYRNVEIVSNPECDAESGVWKTTVRVWTSAPATAFPAYAQIVLFSEDWFGTEKISIGSETWRENIVLVGFICKGTTKKKWSSGYVEFEVESLSGVAENIWQLAGGLETTAGTPGGWHQLQNLTYNLAVHHVLTQHSTLSQIADCYLNLPTYTSEYLDLTDTNLMEQLRQLATPVRGRVGCNMQGSLYLEINPQLQSLASRSSTYAIATTMADFRDEADFGEEAIEKAVSQVDFAGENGDADPVFSLAPSTPWASGQSEKVDDIRVADQTEANEFAGLFEGWKNNGFGNVILPLRGPYPLDVFPAEPIAVSITAAQNARGIVWTNQRCWVKRATIEPVAGSRLVTLEVEKDSYSGPGIAGEYPTEPPVVPPPTTPPIEPPIINPPFPDGPEEGGWRSNQMAFSQNKGVFLTSDFTAPGGAMPTWTAINTGLPSAAARAYSADPFAPSTRQFCIGSDWQLYTRTSGNWNLSLSIATALTLFGLSASAQDQIEVVTANITTPGYFAVVFSHLVGGGGGETFNYAYTADYGATWLKYNTTPIGTNFNGHSQGFGFGLFRGLSSYAAGNVVYFTSYSGGGGTNRLFVSTDSGATWTQRTGFNAATGSSSIQLDMFQNVIYSYGLNTIKRSADLGATWVAISTNSDLKQQGQQVSCGYQLMPAYDPTTSPYADIINAVGYSRNIWKTVNAGVSWAETTLDTTTWGTAFQAHEIGILILGDAQDKMYGISLSGGLSECGHHVVQVSNDGGATWEGKAGADISATTTTGIPSGATILGLLPLYDIA